MKKHGAGADLLRALAAALICSAICALILLCYRYFFYSFREKGERAGAAQQGIAASEEDFERGPDTTEFITTA